MTTTKHKVGRRTGTSMRDTRPEFVSYRDDGCEVSPSCLRCPLPQCKYDDPGFLTRLRREQRDKDVVGLLKQGASMRQAAEESGLTERTVFRIRKRAAP